MRNIAYAPAAVVAPPELPYRAGKVNICPACGNRAWNVGRLVAECAADRDALVGARYRRIACGYVMPIERSSR